MGLLIYVDMMSQPCRAVVGFCIENDIKFELKLINIAKGETRASSFTSINPLGRVPFIDDSGFRLAESHAILKYLIDSRNINNHFYPQDIKSRSLVEQYLHWHPANTRAPISKLVFSKIIGPSFGITTDPVIIKENLSLLKSGLKQINNFFLKDQKFLTGDKLTIADLSCVEEIVMYLLVDSSFLGEYSNIANWIKRCQNNLKSWDETHKVFYKVLTKTNPSAVAFFKDTKSNL